MDSAFEPLSYRLVRRDLPELIDMPHVAEAELIGNLHDLGLVNRAFGGTWLTCWALGHFVQTQQSNVAGTTHAAQPPASLTLLDIGSGLGDIPRAVAQWAARRGLSLRVVATDVSQRIVRIAAGANEGIVHDQQPGEHGPVFYAAADGLRLPFADDSMDVVMCSLTLHHFPPELAITLLREMRRVARRGLVVNDIVRSWPGLTGAWLLGHMLSQNRLTRHDGLVSVRRAYTPHELRALAADANMHVVAARTLLGYRAVLVLR